MFFYLSQFLSFLAMPLTLIVLLFLLALFAKRTQTKRYSMLLGFIFLLFFTNQFIANFVMDAWEPDFKELKTLPNYPLGIVLTGVTNLDKTAYDRTFFSRGADRATHAVQLYKLGKIEKILITGGQGLNPLNPNTEAELLRDFMLIAGVEADDILIENQAKNTRQNALFANEVLEATGYPKDEKQLLITSAFHMHRSKGCFDKVGILTDTYPVDYYGHASKFNLPSLLYPSPDALMTWHRLFKEWIGITTYKIAGYM